MYDLTKDPLTHYDRVTFAIRYGRGHMAEHEALDMPEPEDWCVECDVCGSLPKAAILKERAERAAMSEDESTKYEEAHSKKHFGQCIDQEPVLPYHDSCTDVLHLYLNLVKAAVAHVFHKPFQIEKANYSKEVKEVMSKVRDELNARMKQDFDDKKFGGEGVFSLIGDQVKIFMRGGHNHRLVPDLLAIAEPYFSLLRSDGLVPDDPSGRWSNPKAATRRRARRQRQRQLRRSRLPRLRPRPRTRRRSSPCSSHCRRTGCSLTASTTATPRRSCMTSRTACRSSSSS